MSDKNVYRYMAGDEELDFKDRRPSFVEAYGLEGQDNIAEIEAANALAGYAYAARSEPQMFKADFDALTHIGVLGQDEPVALEDIENGISAAAPHLTNEERRALVTFAHDLFPDSDHDWVNEPVFSTARHLYKPPESEGGEAPGL